MEYLIPAVAASSFVTSVWHELRLRYLVELELVRRCERRGHEWGSATEVAPPPAVGVGTRARYYKAFCRRCPAQRDVNADGSPYVPGPKDDEPSDPTPESSSD